MERGIPLGCGHSETYADDGESDPDAYIIGWVWCWACQGYVRFRKVETVDTRGRT